MIKKTSTSNKWFATCDGGCSQITLTFDELYQLFRWLSDQGWLFGNVHKNDMSFCYECSQKLKRKEPVKEEKKSPVCIARDGEFRSELTFCSTIAKCSRVKKDDICPARGHVLWQWQYQNHTTCHDVYAIHRSPEFLAACSRCLGESQYSVVDKSTKKELPPLHIGKAGVEIRVKQSNEAMCHSSCSFYGVFQGPYCSRNKACCLNGMRCYQCIEEFPLSEVVSENTKEVETPGLKIIDDIAVMLSDEYRCHPYCSFYSTPAFDPWCKRFDSWCVGGRRCQKCINKYPTPVVDAEVTVNDQIDLLEKCVNKITEGYERMFGYLDIISKAVMTIIREKEEK